MYYESTCDSGLCGTA